MSLSALTSFTNKYTTEQLWSRAYETIVTRAYRYQFIRYALRPFFKVPNTEKWIFIVGCYNSGTTLLQKLISSHPEIDYLPKEGVRFTHILPQPEDLGWTRMWVKCPQHMQMRYEPDHSTYKSLQSDWAPMWRYPNVSVRLEKSITNVTRMAWLEQCFPNAYFIGIWRNGYCVSEGIRRRAKPARKTGYPLKNYPIGLAGEQWVAANRLLVEGSKKIKRYTGFSYESLIDNPVNVLESLFSFLEVSPLNIETKSNSIVVNQNKFVLKNQNENSLQRLSSTDIAELNGVVQPVLDIFNYPVIRSSTIK